MLLLAWVRILALSGGNELCCRIWPYIVSLSQSKRPLDYKPILEMQSQSERVVVDSIQTKVN